MNVTTVQRKAVRSLFEASVGVEQRGPRTLVVPAGRFRIDGVDYLLEEDEEIDLPVVDSPAAVFVHLVQERATGAVRVLVDVNPKLGRAPMYDVTSPGSALLGLHMLAIIELPAGDGTLDDVVCRRAEFVYSEDEVAKEDTHGA